MRIAVDAMGGDFAPKNEVLGALKAVEIDPELDVVLVGREDAIRQELSLHKHSDRIIIENATEIISMNDSPTQALKEKKDSSLLKAIQMLKAGKVDSLLSAGNTGAVLAGSMLKLGRIKNVERPAIVAVFPGMKKPLVILDIGANVDCKPKHLLQFAKMGSVFSNKVLGVDNPVVRLLNIGEEEKKGNELTTATYQLLKEENNLNFQGNLEPKYLLDSDTDVVVCDGFVGNVVLKLGEGIVSNIFKLIKTSILKSWISLLGGILVMPAFKRLKRDMDYDEYGGTLLIGVSKVVLIAHGSANPKAMCNAILAAKKVVKEKVVEEIKNTMGKINYQ